MPRARIVAKYAQLMRMAKHRIQTAALQMPGHDVHVALRRVLKTCFSRGVGVCDWRGMVRAR
jgi:hypothetical protein